MSNYASKKYFFSSEKSQFQEEAPSLSCASDNALDVVKVSGRIKWFDVAKGYGFIVPDNGMPDVLLHVTCLRRDGFQIIREGSRIVCDVVRRAQGYQALRVLSLENTDVFAAPKQTDEGALRIVPGDFENATVRWFNRLRGFGFLTCGEEQEDIFIHIEVLRRCGVAELQTGQMVRVRYGHGPKGATAIDVVLLDEEQQTH